MLRRIADALDLEPDGPVVEIGPGLGSLTEVLLDRGARVSAVEVDPGMCEHLARRFEGRPAFHLLCADVLSVSPAAILNAGRFEPPYSVAGNLPYNIAAAAVRRFLEADPRPRRIVVMVQREVAQSMAARPGEMSLLGLSVQLYADARVLFTVPPSAFYPPPRVQSAVVRLDVAAEARAGVTDAAAFFRVARAGFSTPRKQLRNSLATGLRIPGAEAQRLIERAGIDPARRPGDLSLEEWAALTRTWRPPER